MDRLEEMLAGSTFNTTITIPKAAEKKTAPSISRKEGGPGPRSDPSNKTQKPKGNSSSAGKGSKSGSDKGAKNKETEKAAPEEKLKRLRETLEDLDAESSDGQPRGPKLQKILEKKNKEKTVSELTDADFEVVAKVAKLGAEAFEKMKAGVKENTPEKLKGTYLATQAYNRAIEVKLDCTSRELKVARNHWYVELMKENQMLREESEEKADLKKKLSEVNARAAKNKEKADSLSNVAKELELAREDLNRVWKEGEDAEVRSVARIAELEEKCQKLKDDAVLMAIDGYTRCLNQALVLEPNLRTEFMKLTYRVDDGKIIKGEEVIFPPPELQVEEVNNAGINNTEAEDAGTDNTENANPETPAGAGLAGKATPGKAGSEAEVGEN